MGLKTTTIGSLPKPLTLRRARWLHDEGEIEKAALKEAEQQATRQAIELQESLSLDVLVDGQMDRSDMISHFAERLEGMEPVGLVRCYDNRYYRKPRIVGELARPEPICVESWKAAQEITARPLRAILTGPYTLMDWSFDEHYASRDKCCLALAGLLRQEVEDLVAEGVREIQFDEPAISSRPHEMDLVLEAVSRVATDLPGVRTWLHICYADLTPVIEQVLTLPVDGFLLELANSGFRLLDHLEALPQNRLLGAGIVDAASPEIETVDGLKRRIESMLAKVPAGRLWIAPDAGLRALEPETAKAKLEAMVTAAGAS